MRTVPGLGWALSASAWAFCGCGASATVIPLPPEEAREGWAFDGTAVDDVWVVGTHMHWDGAAWTVVSPVNHDVEPDGSPAAAQEMGWGVAGPGLIVVAEYDAQIFTLDAAGGRTDLGKPRDDMYSGAMSVTGHDGVVYATEETFDIGDSARHVWRRDADGWTELPAPPDVGPTANLWATGPDTLWLFGTTTAMFDGSTWVSYDVFAGSHQGWLPLDPTTIVATPLDGWAHWRFDREGWVQVPLEDPTGDEFVEHWPIGMRKNGDGVDLVVAGYKGGAGTYMELDDTWKVTVDAYGVTTDGFTGARDRLEKWTYNGFDPAPGIPSYTLDGTAMVIWEDEIHVWEAR